MRSILRFVKVIFLSLLKGSKTYYAWLAFLLTIVAAGLGGGLYVQLTEGFIATAMTDQVSWGAYIANFTFVVGLTDAAVLVVIPAILFRREAMRDVIWIAMYLAIAAVLMGLLFVMVDIGRPDRFWHMIPPIGLLNWPVSMLSWDVVVLGGYLAITLLIVLYYLFSGANDRLPKRKIWVPAVVVSMLAAVTVHTVTAFLYTWLGARPFWNTAIVAPRFLASAFVVGPAFLIVSLMVVRRTTKFPVKNEVIQTLRKIVAIAMLSNLFLLAAELFKEFKTASHHVTSVVYLFFGLHDKAILVPFIWTALLCNLVAAVIFVSPKLSHRTPALIAACVLAFFGIWVEKGMGLIVPGFVPSPVGEVVEYSPSPVEISICAGVWAFGILVFTLLLKIGIPMQLKNDPALAVEGRA